MVTLPTLPSLVDEGYTDKHFFSATANWVIPGAVMAGGSPARASEGADKYLAQLINDAAVTTFVCLQSEVNPVENAENFGGVNEGNEADELPSYANAAIQVDPATTPTFVYYGIKDEEVASSMQDLQALISNLQQKVQGGEVLYIHCKGGSGRTGLVAACLLKSLYTELTVDEALERIQKCFETRARGSGKWVNPQTKSPATEGQKEQVKKFAVSTKLDLSEAAEDGPIQLCSSAGCTLM
eukprot:scaffold349_cov267-Chaetoceros_neogracile.AAC.39